jgi:hypothetical protein
MKFVINTLEHLPWLIKLREHKLYSSNCNNFTDRIQRYLIALHIYILTYKTDSFDVLRVMDNAN